MSTAARPTQRLRVLQLALQRGNDGFTRWDAATEVGCFELASRIGELEAEGVTFHRHKHTARNRWGDKITVMTYRLTHAPQPILDHLRQAHVR